MSKTWSVPDFILLYRAEAANPGLSVQGGDGKHRNRHARFFAGCAARPGWWRGFRARRGRAGRARGVYQKAEEFLTERPGSASAHARDRKSTRLNSSHVANSYAV